MDSVFSDASCQIFDDGRKAKTNPLNANFEKKEFQELWSRINQKAVYAVDFDTTELVGKCVIAIDKELKVARLQYTFSAASKPTRHDVRGAEGGRGVQAQQTETG